MQNICPICQQPNAASNYYCSNCGTALNDSSIVVSHNQNISVAGYDVTPRQLKQIGASVAVSVLALLAEMSLIYLRRRLDRMRLTPMSRTPSKKSSLRNKSGEIMTTETREDAGEVVTVVRERVVEIRRWGRPMQRVIERAAWRREPKK